MAISVETRTGNQNSNSGQEWVKQQVWDLQPWLTAKSRRRTLNPNQLVAELVTPPCKIYLLFETEIASCCILALCEVYRFIK